MVWTTGKSINPWRSMTMYHVFMLGDGWYMDLDMVRLDFA